MFKNLKDHRSARSSNARIGFIGAAVLLSLLAPTSAQAAEQSTASGSSPSSSSSTEITPDQLSAVSERQISTANSGVPKFNSADLMGKIKDQIETERVARDQRLAEEAAARAAAEEAARLAAEEVARVEAARVAAEAQAAAEKAAAEAKAKSAASSSRSGTSRSTSSGPSSPLYTGGGSKDEWLRASGIAESDWGYVDYIVSKESSWNPNATNASSGASGLVQALPCGKVPGSCFNPVDNLKWANGYAVGRYGSWAQAYAFWTSNHWW